MQQKEDTTKLNFGVCRQNWWSGCYHQSSFILMVEFYQGTLNNNLPVQTNESLLLSRSSLYKQHNKEISRDVITSFEKKKIFTRHLLLHTSLEPLRNSHHCWFWFPSSPQFWFSALLLLFPEFIPIPLEQLQTINCLSVGLQILYSSLSPVSDFGCLGSHNPSSFPPSPTY